MPFTGSHAAAALPFLRTPLPASALVAGTLAPDLPSCFPVHPGFRTHTPLAVVTADLLLGVALWAVWHGVPAAPAHWATPATLRGRLTGVPLGLRRRLPRLAWVAAAVVVGAGTHVLWDEFTHPRRWGPEHLSVLADTWGGPPGHRWAQEVSGVLGLVVVLGWLALWWRRTPAVPTAPRPRWWVPWALVAGAGVAAAVTAVPGAPDPRSAAVDAAFRGGAVAMATALALALLWWCARTRASVSP